MARFDNGYHEFAVEHEGQLDAISRDHARLMGEAAALHAENVEGGGVI